MATTGDIIKSSMFDEHRRYIRDFLWSNCPTDSSASEYLTSVLRGRHPELAVYFNMVHAEKDIPMSLIIAVNRGLATGIYSKDIVKLAGGSRVVLPVLVVDTLYLGTGYVPFEFGPLGDGDDPYLVVKHLDLSSVIAGSDSNPIEEIKGL